MEALLSKEELKTELIKPKVELRKARLSKELTTDYMAKLIGLKNRRQYELKENGKAAFHDYEMLIISNKLNKSVMDLFFNY